jgi:hypothetical protein
MTGIQLILFETMVNTQKYIIGKVLNLIVFMYSSNKKYIHPRVRDFFQVLLNGAILSCFVESTGIRYIEREQMRVHLRN